MSDSAAPIAAGFWATMPPADGAAEALREMVAAGLDVVMVSTPDSICTGRCASEKYDWVERVYGAEWKARLILATDKTWIRGKICLVCNDLF